ncbi:nucleotidyltransferase family protein [Caldivirga maquilingensis]|uniref:DNA polymerase beta domain protein region n=1 Tax=Caldivirga maquilingensis (strain ATCC 700844 / DSM 13496 / JCM 10307 / IC-167) TaxID=397948 RepID=A8MD61_CALMQ|nr:nucleotidyltransferase domain-containing protein [Caldivirga maquilingensis]ABW01717.1 DNA polymerase beta domain protein region [Caldivirga maquilingensis IC-167]
MSINEIINSLSNACRELDNELKDEFLGLMLFGSWARGEAKFNSDVDVMVLLNSVKGLEVRVKVYSILRKYISSDITLVDVRRSELEGGLTALSINIAWDGVIICDKYGYLARFKNEVKRFIEEEGLIRYRTPDGKYGWTRADGKPLIKVNKSNV